VTRSPVLEGYARAVEALIPAWEALSPAQIYAPVLQCLPDKPARILDVGAGTGRDAGWFAGQGHQVCAVEPVAAFRTAGQKRRGVTWFDDTLPDLARLRGSDRLFDLITANGVLHHLPPDQQLQALPALVDLIKPNGRVILSLRHGPAPADRPVFPVKTSELIEKSASLGLYVLHEVRGRASLQAGNRASGVSWDWLVFSAE